MVKKKRRGKEAEERRLEAEERTDSGRRLSTRK